MPQRAPKLSVIVPCLNEAENIPLFEDGLLSPLSALNSDFEVIFADGGSSDATLPLLRELEKRHPEVRILAPSKPAGFGLSLAEGIKISRGEFVATMEADLSFDPSDIKKFLAVMEADSLDCVAGSPFLGRFEDISVVRKCLTFCANSLLRVFFYPGLTAYTQIFRLYRGASIRALRLRETGFTVDAEILIKAARSGLKIREMPVVMRGRKKGRSKMRVIGETLNYLKLIGRLGN